MKNRTISDLEEAVTRFITPLRDGSGFDDLAFQQLCSVLEDLSHQWAKLDAIPKAAASVLVDLWPGIFNCAYLYGEGDESNQIMKAADVIADLTRNIVKE